MNEAEDNDDDSLIPSDESTHQLPSVILEMTILEKSQSLHENFGNEKIPF
jgi:hypothetical protein